jgi:anti-sigma B factor antagonist
VLLSRHDEVAARVAVRGEIDVAEAPAIGRRLAAELAAGRDVVVDLREMTFIDSSGLAVLLDAARSAERHGRDLRILRPRPLVMRTFELAGLADRLPFADD